MSLIENIAKSQFVATPAQVEQLAAQQHTNASLANLAGGTYLRVLIANTINAVGRKARKHPSITVLDALDKVHEELYAAVQRGVTTMDMKSLDEAEQARELNRRCAFARTAKSTIRTYVRSGGDLWKLTIGEVSKQFLYRAFQPPEPADRTERMLLRAQSKLVKSLRREMKVNAEAAEEHIGTLMDELAGMLREITQPKAVRVVKHSLRKNDAVHQNMQ
jgi:hypothetical protein